MAKRVQHSSLRRWVPALLGVVAVAMLIVWEQNEAHSLERRLQPMRSEVDRLRYENAHLQMQLNQWMTPAHLDSVARNELNMAPLDPSHVIALDAP